MRTKRSSSPDVFDQRGPLDLPQIRRIEAFPYDLRLERDAPGSVILQEAAVFDDLVPEQRRRLIEDHEIEIVVLEKFCKFFHQLEPVVPRLDSPVEIDGNVRIAEGSGLAARPRSEQVGELYPFILFKNEGQVLMVSLSNHSVLHGVD